MVEPGIYRHFKGNIYRVLFIAKHSETMEDMVKVFQKYEALNAAACDGGSSSVMAYDGKIITKCSSPMKTGRYLPNAFLVKRIETE